METINDLDDDNFFNQTAIIGKRYTSLKVDIFSMWCGTKEPYIIIGSINRDVCYVVTTTISTTPTTLAQTPIITKSQMQNIQDGINYVAKNYDLFLKHYIGQFDDDNLIEALAKRGYYNK